MLTISHFSPSFPSLLASSQDCRYIISKGGRYISASIFDLEDASEAPAVVLASLEREESALASTSVHMEPPAVWLKIPGRSIQTVINVQHKQRGNEPLGLGCCLARICSRTAARMSSSSSKSYAPGPTNVSVVRAIGARMPSASVASPAPVAP